jgi:hypothetical protein
MNNTCQCGEPATRLIRVVNTQPDPDGQRRSPFSFDRSTAFAACEPHRHSASEILARQWTDEITTGEVKILMGRKRRKGS